MKKKFGFTLAEVLITLGIIGVVAALTAPALVKNSGQAKIGPSLAKFVNTWETGAEQMMQEQSINSISSAGSLLKAEMQDGEEGDHIVDSGLVSSPFMDIFSHYIIMTPLENNTEYKYYSPNGTTSESVVQKTSLSYNDDYATQGRWNHNGASLYTLKDGSLIVFYPFKIDMKGENPGIIEPKQHNGDTYTANKAYRGSVGYILYDINGINGNNKAGKEVFKFIVDDSGTLVPYASNAHKHLVPSFNTSCSANSSSIDEGLACTGEIADNAWKADY